MDQQETGKERNKKKEKPSKTSGVIITVYVESTRNGRHRNSDSGSATKRKHCSSKPPTSSKYGSNRKAQLLAYAQQLRCYNSKQIEWPGTKSRPKRKWSWGLSRSKFRRIFYTIKRRWRYQRIASEEEKTAEERSGRHRKTIKSIKTASSHFSRRFRCMLKKLCCSWKCNQGLMGV